MKHKKTAVLLVLLIALAALTWKLSTWLTPQQLQQALQQTGGWAPGALHRVVYSAARLFLPGGGAGAGRRAAGSACGGAASIPLSARCSTVR